MLECQTALIFNLKFANINFPRVQNEAAWRNLDSFHVLQPEMDMTLFIQFSNVTF